MTEHIGMINAHMFGTESAPGEHVNWSAPDIASRGVWEDLLIGGTVEEYAAANPHMIVFLVGADTGGAR